MKTAVMLAVVTVLAGCSRESSNRTPGTGHRTQDTGHERIDWRSQRDLAMEIGAAEKLPEEQAAARYDQIRKGWLGKRVTWTLDLVPALCRSADSCHALAFDRLGADRAIVQGWMPRLRLDRAGFAAYQTGCASRARCPVTVEATVAALTLSVDEPTSLTLADVRVAPAGS